MAYRIMNCNTGKPFIDAWGYDVIFHTKELAQERIDKLAHLAPYHMSHVETLYFDGSTDYQSHNDLMREHGESETPYEDENEEHRTY